MESVSGWGVRGKPWPGRAEENFGIWGSFRLCHRANSVWNSPSWSVKTPFFRLRRFNISCSVLPFCSCTGTFLELTFHKALMRCPYSFAAHASLTQQRASLSPAGPKIATSYNPLYWNPCAHYEKSSQYGGGGGSLWGLGVER